MERSSIAAVRADLDTKIVLLTGPRQSGKTTLSRMLWPDFAYFNYDSPSDRLALNQRNWPRASPLVIFDELHKMKRWKSWIKGVYDTEGCRPRLLVTGSARLDSYRKMGDSLAGRFFQHRLHPLDLKELAGSVVAEEAFVHLLQFGGFPEPFLKGSENFYKRWVKGHLDIILRQDLLDMESVRDIVAIETLAELLKQRVGAPISYSNLARDLERDAKTVKRWLALLESLYVVFKVTPYHKNVARALLKEPKYYFYDTGQVQGDVGVKLENLVACALLKELDHGEDTCGTTAKLSYIRTKDGREIDFLVVIDGTPRMLIEVKWADDVPSKHFKNLGKFFPNTPQVQVVRKLAREQSYPSGVQVKSAVGWLRTLDFSTTP